jgi:hypothetical protein
LAEHLFAETHRLGDQIEDLQKLVSYLRHHNELQQQLQRQALLQQEQQHMKQLQQQALLQAQAWSQDFQHCALKLWINRSRLKTWNKWNEERRRSLRARKAVRFWSQRVSTKALIKWKSWGRETERLQALGVRALGRWRRKVFSLCWNCWHKNLLRSKRLRLVLRCFVLRWTHRGLSKCWETWQRELRLTSITTVVLKRWANRHIHAAWEAWILSLTEIKRLKTVVKRVTARIQNICLARRKFALK